MVGPCKDGNVPWIWHCVLFSSCDTQKHKYLCCCCMFSQIYVPIFLVATATLSCLYIVSKFSACFGIFIHLFDWGMALSYSVSSSIFLFPNLCLRTQRAPGYLPRFWRSPVSGDHLVRTNQLTQTNPLTQTQADLSQGSWVLGSFSVEPEVVKSCSRYYWQLLQN